jgi:hypothetical protein
MAIGTSDGLYFEDEFQYLEHQFKNSRDVVQAPRQSGNLEDLRPVGDGPYNPSAVPKSKKDDLRNEGTIAAEDTLLGDMLGNRDLDILAAQLESKKASEISAILKDMSKKSLEPAKPPNSYNVSFERDPKSNLLTGATVNVATQD